MKTRKRRIVFATGNEGKMREIRAILGEEGLEIFSLGEAGISARVEEDGATFEENALLKARAAARLTGGVVLADDSGLEVDWLNGEPGVYSARYLGEDTPYGMKNQRILERMEGVEEEKRTARFVSAVAAVFPDGQSRVVRETMEGVIGREARGNNGFGYDPIFYLPACGRTAAELTPEEKNRESHRGKALRRMKDILEEKLGEC